VRVDVDEYRPGTRTNDCARGREKAEGSSNDCIARLNAAAGDREPQSIGPGCAPDGVINSQERGDFTLKGLDFLAQYEVLGRAHAFQGGQNLFAD
jgi:hypothetical protein